jgi:hypothetical protein
MLAAHAFRNGALPAPVVAEHRDQGQQAEAGEQNMRHVVDQRNHGGVSCVKFSPMSELNAGAGATSTIATNDYRCYNSQLKMSRRAARGVTFVATKPAEACFLFLQVHLLA